MREGSGTLGQRESPRIDALRKRRCTCFYQSLRVFEVDNLPGGRSPVNAIQCKLQYIGLTLVST